MFSHNRRRLVSLNISVGSYNQLQELIANAAINHESRTVCCANAHMVIEAKLKPDVNKSVNEADWVAPDGMPLVWAMRALYALRQDRIAGMDLAASLLTIARDRGISVFFYGATMQVLQKLHQVCTDRFPGLVIAGMVAPPFRNSVPQEEDSIIKQISDSGAGLVFVILGCPKQELWMSKMRGKVPAVMIGLGGALLVMAGYQKRAPNWMQRFGIEWLFRLLQEPRRLFKRYALTNTLFLWYISKQWFGLHSVR